MPPFGQQFVARGGPIPRAPLDAVCLAHTAANFQQLRGDRCRSRLGQAAEFWFVGAQIFSVVASPALSIRSFSGCDTAEHQQDPQRRNASEQATCQVWPRLLVTFSPPVSAAPSPRRRGLR